MTAAVVSRLPTHSVTVSGPSDPIGRYSSTRFSSADRRGDQRKLQCRQRRPEIPEILRKPDVARRNFQRTAQNELPDEEERRRAVPIVSRP